MTTELSGHLLEIAEALAWEAGERARLRQARARVVAAKDHRHDIVTEADIGIERLVLERLARLRPGDGVLAEEGARSVGTTGITWVIDPIDGTTNYAYGSPHWAVSIAAVDRGEDPAHWRVLAGVVSAPALGEHYAARIGGGATMNGERMHARDSVDVTDAIVSTGFSPSPRRRELQLTVAGRLFGVFRDIRRHCSSTLDICSVASGRVDAFYYHGLRPWDLAAASLVATEAGAAALGPGGLAADGRLAVIAPQPLAAQLLGLIETASSEAVHSESESAKTVHSKAAS